MRKNAFLFDSRNFKTIEKQYLMTKPMLVFSKFLFLWKNIEEIHYEKD